MNTISRIVIDEPDCTPKGLVIALTGRGVSIGEMYNFIMCAGLNQSLIVVIEPKKLQWYPQPFGAFDQEEAVAGALKSVKPIKKRIKMISRNYKIPLNKTAIVGYSAGGVMALEIAKESEQEFAMFISIAGTILEPRNLSPAKHQSPILMKMCKYDEIFDWYERHIPARTALLENKYNLILEEINYGGHALTYDDSQLVKKHLMPVLGYDIP